MLYTTVSGSHAGTYSLAPCPVLTPEETVRDQGSCSFRLEEKNSLETASRPFCDYRFTNELANHQSGRSFTSFTKQRSLLKE